MSYSTYSIEGRTKRLMDSRGASAEFLAGLATASGVTGASQSRISQALRGYNPFNTAEHQAFGELVDNLEAFLVSVHPLPILLRDPGLVAILVEEFIETRQIKAQVVRQAAEAADSVRT